MKTSIFPYFKKNEQKNKKKRLEAQRFGGFLSRLLSHDAHQIYENSHENYENSDQNYQNSDQNYETLQNSENSQILEILPRAISF